ncbi:MAG TPA: NAD(P)-dependent oxidoreductase [Longimicrobiales bacterium]|nr:NAD(P)-dependent oxidoreductase [Longimicrobiales bacterium]
MKVFIAGATGVLGRRLVSLLVREGHEVIGMTRTPSKRDLLQELGARPVVADALDAEAVHRAIRDAAPDVVVHEMTALSELGNLRNYERAFAQNARLRSEATDILLAASREVGARRFVAQSFGGYLFGGNGKRVLTEDDALDAHPPRPFERILAADRHLETAVTGAPWIEGIVLRYGLFYGPGTTISLRPPGTHSEGVRKRQFPIVGDGAGLWSFIHVDDAASATVAAIERGRRGIYHITDDEPAPATEWLPGLAAALGAPPPRRVPKWLARLAAGKAVVVMMTEAHGAANAKARRELGWEPKYRTWREGFAHGLG